MSKGAGARTKQGELFWGINFETIVFVSGGLRKLAGYLDMLCSYNGGNGAEKTC